MSTTRLALQSALLIRALLLAAAALVMSAACAQAGTVTYNIGPLAFPDLNNSAFTDFVTGTVTLNNTAGSPFTTYVFNDPSLSNVIMSADLTMSTNAPGVLPVTIDSLGEALNDDTSGNRNWLQQGSLTATSAGLFLSHDGYLSIDYEIGSSFPKYIAGEIDPHDDNGTISLYANPGGGVNNGGETMQIFPQNLDDVLGSGAWPIGSPVPEPSTLALLAMGVVAMGIAASIRRRAVQCR